MNHTKGRNVEDVLEDLMIDSGNSGENRAICPLCGLIYPDDGGPHNIDNCLAQRLII